MKAWIEQFSIRERFIIGITAFVLVGSTLAIAWQSKGIDIPLLSETHSPAQAGAGSRGLSTPVQADLSRCVTLWNGPANDYGRQLITGSPGPPPYVYVDFSATFPDRCLITAANLDIGTAYQFIEKGQTPGGLGPFGLPAAQLSVNELPPTDWNASSDNEGYILLGD